MRQCPGSPHRGSRAGCLSVWRQYPGLPGPIAGLRLCRRRRSPLPRQVSHTQTLSWFHRARGVTTFNTVRALAARAHLLDSTRDHALLAAALPFLPPSPHAVHPFAADSLQASLCAELPAPVSDFATLSRSVSPDLEFVLPLGLRYAASLSTDPLGLSMMH